MPLVLLTALAAFLSSLAAKLLADHFLVGRVGIVGSFVGLQRTLNPGISFGLRIPSPLQEALIGIALVLVLALAWRTARSRVARVGYGLIAGGALENVADRLFDGRVTDFFQIGSFPIFNVADCCITAGVLLLLWVSLKERA